MAVVSFIGTIELQRKGVCSFATRLCEAELAAPFASLASEPIHSPNNTPSLLARLIPKTKQEEFYIP